MSPFTKIKNIVKQLLLNKYLGGLTKVWPAVFCAVTTRGALIVVTLLLGAAKFATTAGPLGTWYEVPAGLVAATMGVVERVSWADLCKDKLPEA